MYMNENTTEPLMIVKYLESGAKQKHCAINCPNKTCLNYYSFIFETYRTGCKIKDSYKFSLCKKPIKHSDNNMKAKSKKLKLISLIILAVLLVVILILIGVFCLRKRIMTNNANMVSCSIKTFISENLISQLSNYYIKNL